MMTTRIGPRLSHNARRAATWLGAPEPLCVQPFRMVAKVHMQRARDWLDRHGVEGWLAVSAGLVLAASSGACASKRAGIPRQPLKPSPAATASAVPHQAPGPPALVDQRRTQLRLRVTGLDPAQPPRAGWRHGGEG